MAAPNFYTQDGFPLFATTIFEIEDCNDDETGEIVEGFFDYLHYEFCKEKIEELNDNLQFYRLDLDDGRYSGVQTVLNPSHPNITLSKDYTAKEWREWRKEARDYPYAVNSCDFTLPYAEQKKAEQREKRKIIDFCRTVLKDNFCFEEYGVYARFSNGETWYNKVA